ncbi:unnamed protein product [Allacma fusca]|uniref:Uncharacterized protein n=1 Tax=Allacma fusca TaxID=39272 RepID=A0A8J2KJD7_9HEXA|nr:unnamed protein product [Allacma fusca]
MLWVRFRVLGSKFQLSSSFSQRKRVAKMINQPPVKVINITATFNVGPRLDMTKVTKYFWPNQTTPRKEFRVQKGSIIVRIFPTGEARALGQMTPAGFYNYRVTNIVGESKLCHGVNLKQLSTLFEKSVNLQEDEDDRFAHCSFSNLGSIAHVYNTGSVILIGNNLAKMELANLAVARMAQDVWRAKNKTNELHYIVID